SLVVGGLLLGGLLLLLGAPGAAQAAGGTLFVTPGGSGDCSQSHPCDLPTALNLAGDGDVVYLAQGTYTGIGAAVITLTKHITLYGGWDGAPRGAPHRSPATHPTILDGEDARRGIYVAPGLAPVLDGLVITRGSAAGLGGFASDGQEYDAGGGVYVAANAASRMRECVISHSTADTGGGLFLQSSNAEVEECTIEGNTAQWGGGVRAVSGAPAFRRCRILANTAMYGGGMYLMWTLGAVVEDTVFAGNAAQRGGGAYLSGASATLQGNFFRGNWANQGGGLGIQSGGSSVVVVRNWILGNTVGMEGGGVYIAYNEARVDNNVIADNQGSWRGPGVYVKEASPTLRHNTVARNAGGDGAGVHVEDASPTLRNTILVGHAVGITATAGSTVTMEATLWGSGPWANAVDRGGDGLFATTADLWGAPGFV
ncbi:MAG: right-handed parallel beta-helix repeat-containing protein, partial [Anaerolineae bacterium]|nr:right-handed parallel beta-helix repeat-containing protein [Anaerolineae bacterium]